MRSIFATLERASNRPLAVSVTVLLLLARLASQAAAEELFVSKPLTQPNKEYVRIEGPAVDASGDLYYVVRLKQNKGRIDRVRAGRTRSESYTPLPAGSIGNGIRFDQTGKMFVADWKGHNVFVLEPGQKTPKPYLSDKFNQPNDLAISADGTLYASDPHFNRPTGGQIWRITSAGKGAVMESPRPMGVTNGLDLSPDGKTLYVGESNTNEIWAYRIDGDKLVEARLVKKFKTGEPDGLRTDIDGRILVARQNISKVTMLSPDGTVVRHIATKGTNPSNLTFGGADGRTVYVTQDAGGYVEQFISDRRGRETCPQGASC